MKYFNTLPKIISINASGSSIILTNLLARASVRPAILNNSIVYYDYLIQEGDTPEIIAEKYYGDSYRYWIVLYINQITDPQWQWPLNSHSFTEYLNDKYPNIDVYATVHSYQKVITKVTQTIDSAQLITTVDVLTVDQDTYNSIGETTITYTFPESSVTITTTRNVLSIYDYEFSLNESYRSIKLLNSKYVDQIESELKTLMAA